jgi:hypothetical protein
MIQVPLLLMAFWNAEAVLTMDADDVVSAEVCDAPGDAGALALADGEAEATADGDAETLADGDGLGVT